RAASASFPAARLQPQKGIEPRARILGELELSPDQAALLTKAPFFSPDFLQGQPGDGAAQIALGVGAGLEERAGRPVPQPEWPLPRLQLLHEELMHGPFRADRWQLDQGRPGLSDQPVERRGERLARTVPANQGR